MKEKGLDVGFAYDGDADRCLCVDENGDVVTGDHILYIYGKYMKERGKLLMNTVVTTVMSNFGLYKAFDELGIDYAKTQVGDLYIYGKYMKERGKLLMNTVVTTVMSNFGLYKAFDELGIDYAKTQVGDKYVYEYMMANGCRLGGEQSGHIIFSKYASTGDGILTSLKIMEAMLAKKKTLSQLCEGFTVYPGEQSGHIIFSKYASTGDGILTSLKIMEAMLAKKKTLSQLCEGFTVYPQVLKNVIIFSKYASTGDGILTSLKIMEAMLAKKKTLSQLCEGFTVYPQVLKNVRVTDKAAAQADPDVQQAVAQVAAKLGDTGRILVRESGTEPVIPVMVEAPDKAICEECVEAVVSVIRAKGHC